MAGGSYHSLSYSQVSFDAQQVRDEVWGVLFSSNLGEEISRYEGMKGNSVRMEAPTEARQKPVRMQKMVILTHF